MTNMDKFARPKSAGQNSFSGRVASVNGVKAGCKTISVALQGEPGGRLRDAVLLGVEGQHKGRGVIVRDKEGFQAHIFYSARALRQLSKGEDVQVDWTPLGEHLMTNIAITITDPDCGKEDPAEG
jgi:hypothetical protein